MKTDKIIKVIQEVHEQFKGGAGSGNFGHSGRPGKRGGSAGGSGGGGSMGYMDDAKLGSDHSDMLSELTDTFGKAHVLDYENSDIRARTMFEIPGKFKGVDKGNGHYQPTDKRVSNFMASFNFVQDKKNPTIWRGIGGRDGAQASVYGLDNVEVGGEGKRATGVRIEITERV